MTIWLSAWTRTTGGPCGAEVLSIEAKIATGGQRKAHVRRRDATDELDGHFTDRAGAA